MYKKQSLLQSFLNAARGFAFVVREERNMRVALTFIPPVVAYGLFAALSRVELSLTLFCIGMVCLAEIVNSSIENTIDCTVREYHPLAGKAKDMGAAVTLTASVISFAVGIIILYRPDKLLALLQLLAQPFPLLLSCAYIALSIRFILWEKK